MKGEKFTTVQNTNTTFEIYNVVGEFIYCVELNKKGERRSPNAKTLSNFTASQFSRLIELNAIILL